jgi:menaquinol-cytochrome c reductase iron-sulfur subunit
VTGTAYTAGAIAGAALSVPVLGFALAPLFDRAPVAWQEIGPLPRFTDSTYVPLTITIERGVRETGLSLAYVRNHNAALDGPVKDQYDHVVAISSRCVHVGCSVRYVPAAAAFVCPCHGGVYDVRGHRTSGPSPRPLDRFYTLVRDGQVWLGPRFSVNSELKRFHRGPRGSRSTASARSYTRRGSRCPMRHQGPRGRRASRLVLIATWVKNPVSTDTAFRATVA